MAKYQSVTGSDPARYDAFSLATPAPCTPGTTSYPGRVYSEFTPGSVSRDYVPKKLTMRVSDPTKAQKRNWTKIKKSGDISMTPYSNFREETENFVVSRDMTRAFGPWTSRICNSTTPPSVNVKDHGVLVSRWTENDHIGSLSPLLSMHSDSSDALEDFAEQVRKAINTTQSAAFAASLSSFDVLTQIAEGKETLSYLQSKVKEAADALRKFAHEDERTHRRARGTAVERLLKSSDKAFRRYGSRWMEYRYAIMPIIYAIKDVNELLGKRSEVYKTDRDYERIDVSFERPDIELGSHILYRTGSLKAHVRSTVKSAYNKGALQRVLAQSGFNVFTTAWELIPYSFVVDWFLNVGDVIASQTSLDLSSQKACCTSVRESRIISVWRHDSTDDSRDLVDPVSATWPSGRVRPYVYLRNQDDLLQTSVVESYNRTLWSKPKPVLEFNPFLNWKRFLDGLVLSYQPTKKLLRSL